MIKTTQEEFVEFICMMLTIFVVVGFIFWAVEKCSTPENIEDNRWYQLGQEAKQMGVPAEANPYTDSYSRERWLRGWMSDKSSKGQN